MKRLALALAASLLLPVAARATDIDKYKPEIFEDPAKLAKKAGDHLELDEFKDIKEKRPQRMAVTEFTVSFITQSLKTNSVMVMGNTTEQNFDFGGDHMGRMTDHFYKAFVEAVKAKGIEIVPLAELAASPFYAALVGDDGGLKKARGGPGHLGKGGMAAKVDIWSPEGLRDLDWSGDTEELNEANEAKLIEGMGIDGVFHVNVMVGIFHAEYPSVEVGTKISHRLGFKTSKHKKTGAIEYGYVDWGDAGLTTGLYTEDSVVTGKDRSGKGVRYEVDKDAFEAAVTKMWTAVVKMAATGM